MPRGLADEFAARLSADITSGRLPPGSRLPTEQEMIAATGVSRTVVREAVAALRAEGLVVTRQGVGAFVTDRPCRPFRIAADTLSSVREIVQVMELRMGIEIEAAGLAAERGSEADIAAIAQALAALDEAIASNHTGADEDFAFHCCIARATGNPKFVEFLEYLGRFIIPRNTVTLVSDPTQRSEFLRVFQKEHRAIVDALASRDVAASRAAMQTHLSNSRRRYSKLAAEIELPPSGVGTQPVTHCAKTR